MKALVPFFVFMVLLGPISHARAQDAAAIERGKYIYTATGCEGCHAAGSRHFRRDEHYWYFTDAGLCVWMDRHGFQLRERDNIETLLGREDISSYAFERVR